MLCLIVVNIFVVYVNLNIDDEFGEFVYYSFWEIMEKVFKKFKIIIWGLKKIIDFNLIRCRF